MLRDSLLSHFGDSRSFRLFIPYLPQGSVCPASRAELDLIFGNNPDHALRGLADFSHLYAAQRRGNEGVSCPIPRCCDKHPIRNAPRISARARARVAQSPPVTRRPGPVT